MRIDLEVLNPFDLIITTSTSDSESMRLKGRCPNPNVAPHCVDCAMTRESMVADAERSGSVAR